jgi:hypothetical protein
MPKGHATSLFVSSTCYDLSQLRADIFDFANTLGLDPILSELDSFPVDPELSTVSNCLEIVRSRADIFLLIVGGRYGSMTEAGKSITNLEFLEASARGIPRYVFVQRNIISLLPIWEANRDADFSASVDTTKLFEFVAGLRNSGDLWVFPFDSAQDVIRTMRKQLSYLMADCLNIRARLKSQDNDVLSLGPQTLRLYIDKPTAWEYKAFARAVQECMALHRAKKFDYELGLNFDDAIKIEGRIEGREWIQAKSTQIVHVIDQLTRAVNEGLIRAVGAPGEPGDIARIWHLAERVADAYSAVLGWALEFDRLIVDDALKAVMPLARALVCDMITQIENFAANLYDEIIEVLKKPEAERRISIMLTVSDTTALMSEMERLYE